MLFAIVPDAPPTRKNHRATSCPAPISAKVPYLVLSRLIWTAFWWVSSRVDSIASSLRLGWGRSRPVAVDREVDAEPGADADGAVDVDPAGVLGDDPVADAEAEAGP